MMGYDLRLTIVSLALVLLTHLFIATLAMAQVPEFYGIYAQHNNALVRLEGATDASQAVFNSDVRFTVYEKWTSNMAGVPLSQMLEIRRLFYIRNHVLTTPMDQFYPQQRPTIRAVNKWGADKVAHRYRC